MYTVRHMISGTETKLQTNLWETMFSLLSSCSSLRQNTWIIPAGLLVWGIVMPVSDHAVRERVARRRPRWDDDMIRLRSSFCRCCCCCYCCSIVSPIARTGGGGGGGVGKRFYLYLVCTLYTLLLYTVHGPYMPFQGWLSNHHYYSYDTRG